MTRFLHTADLQIGKPFADFDDPHNRALLQQERLNVLARIAQAASDHHAEFLLIAGDLFDSPTVTKATVSAACSAIGKLGIPVFAIPGNHDHGGPSSIWSQPFFQREQASLAPNLRVLLSLEPVELDTAIIYPCPLLRRAETTDPTLWLRAPEMAARPPGNKTRIILAHGSVQDFGTAEDDALVTNLIDLARLPQEGFDYIALGDWHGTKQIGPKAWYAGTPERDRFPRGDTNQPGHVLAVTAAAQESPQVAMIPTSRFRWNRVDFHFSGDQSLPPLRNQIEHLLENRVQEDVLHLELDGSLGVEAFAQLETLVEELRARLLRLKLSNRTVLAPTDAELEALTNRMGDPLISRVAAQLAALAGGSTEDAEAARVALRELHSACTKS
jgi:DNA repair exonuclease SbcCD nuclease subunit